MTAERYIEHAESLPTVEEKAYELLRVAAHRMRETLDVLEGWDDDFDSRSISEAVWAARDRLRAALDALPPSSQLRRGQA